MLLLSWRMPFQTSGRCKLRSASGNVSVNLLAVKPAVLRAWMESRNLKGYMYVAACKLEIFEYSDKKKGRMGKMPSPSIFYKACNTDRRATRATRDSALWACGAAGDRGLLGTSTAMPRRVYHPKTPSSRETSSRTGVRCP